MEEMALYVETRPANIKYEDKIAKLYSRKHNIEICNSVLHEYINFSYHGGHNNHVSAVKQAFGISQRQVRNVFHNLLLTN